LRKIGDISDKMADILDESGNLGRTNHYSMIFGERKRVRRRVSRMRGRKTEIRLQQEMSLN
jgi:hypothetical protein